MRDTIKNHKHFIMHPDDPVAKSSYFLVRVCPTRWPGNAQYGLIVTKRTFRHAVDRNRAKRLLREWIRRYENYMRPDLDYIFIARAPILGATRDQGYESIRKALHYLRRTVPVADAVKNDSDKK